MVATSVSAATTTYYHNDVLGSPVVATDASGNVLWKENYRPYGDKLNNQAASTGNKIGFAAQPFDNNTGLSYMGARYYDPVVGRFTGVDPAAPGLDQVHTLNRYTYANNNPYKYVDSDGRLAFIPVIMWAVLALGAIGTAAQISGGSRVDNRSLWEKDAGVPPRAGPQRLYATPPDDADSGSWEVPQEAKDKIPAEWGEGEPNRKGEGQKWQDPNDKGSGVRVDKGNPDNSQPSQQVDHVVVRDKGRVIGSNGQPINGSIKENPSQAHIPLRDWVRWSSWNKP